MAVRRERRMEGSSGIIILAAGAACSLIGLLGFLITIGRGPAQRKRLRDKINEEMNA